MNDDMALANLNIVELLIYYDPQEDGSGRGKVTQSFGYGFSDGIGFGEPDAGCYVPTDCGYGTGDGAGDCDGVGYGSGSGEGSIGNYVSDETNFNAPYSLDAIAVTAPPRAKAVQRTTALRKFTFGEGEE